MRQEITVRRVQYITDDMSCDVRTALHVAMQLGHMTCSKVLLEESVVNLLSLNLR